jgi:hypothetical protein
LKVLLGNALEMVRERSSRALFKMFCDEKFSLQNKSLKLKLQKELPTFPQAFPQSNLFTGKTAINQNISARNVVYFRNSSQM